MTSTMTRVPPERQPVRPAIALVIISLVTMLMGAVGIALVYAISATGLFDGAAWAQDLGDGPGLVGRIIVLSVVVLAFIGVFLGLKLASVVLGILVVVRGDGKLRIGASMLLAVTLLELFFSVSLEGSSITGTVADVLTVLGWAATLARWGVMVAGVVVLWLGIREVRSARAGRPLDRR